MKASTLTLALVLVLALPSAAAAADYRLEIVTDELEYPWSIDFLPNGEYLVAMRHGEVRRVSRTGEVGEPISGGPPTYFAGQGGYFDVLLAPNHARSRIVYLCYADGMRKANRTAVFRAELRGDRFENGKVIYRAIPSKDTPLHYGGKLLFLRDGTLLLTTGDGFEYREAAQDEFSELGKVIRINADGSVPADNPFADGMAGGSKVFSYGHRNPQGLALDPRTGDIYLHEHGPRGGDEVNLIVAGANYGWPAATYGVNYSGAIVSPYTQLPGVTDPLHYWVPSIAPSGLAFYAANVFPEWRGDLLVGALVDREVRRLDLEDGKVVGEEPLFAELGERIRDVRVGPRGDIYLLTDAGKLVRVTR